MPTTFTEFWTEVVSVWSHGLYGVDIGNIITALVIFLAFLIFRGFLSRYILRRLHIWAEKSTAKLDDSIIEALIPPIKFIPLVLGIFFAGKALGLTGDMAFVFSNAVRSMIAFAIFWSLHRAIDPIRRVFKKLDKVLSKAMVDWIFKAMKVFVIFIGAAVILEIWGIAVAPLLAGFGLLGVAVALGAQDLFKNLIAGLTVIAEKRFSPGDWILVEGVVEGTVEEIGFRSTKIRRFDLAPMHVPNAQLADTVVTNFSRMPYRRVRWLVGVTYDTGLDQLKMMRDEILAYIMSRKDLFATPDEAPTMVRIDSFNASSLDILVNCFTRPTLGDPFFAAKEELAFAIKDIVEDKAGGAFAFPSQSIYIENLPGIDKPEVFVPPEKPKRKEDARKKKTQ